MELADKDSVEVRIVTLLDNLLPHAHAQGVKQSVCPSVVVVVGTKMPGSGDIGS